EETPRQKKQASHSANWTRRSSNRKKSERRTSRSFGCTRPVGDRPMERTDSTRWSSRHSSSTPAPTMPVAPNRRTFTGTPPYNVAALRTPSMPFMGCSSRGASPPTLHPLPVPGAYTPRMKRMSALEWGLLLTLSILWGGSFFFQKVALAALPPFTVLLARVGLAAAALGLAVRVTGHSLPPLGRARAGLAIMATLNNVIPFSLILWGQTRIASGLAAILNACTPLFTAVLAHFLTADERLTPRRIAGVLLGLAGVVLMIGPDTLGGLGADVAAAPPGARRRGSPASPA